MKKVQNMAKKVQNMIKNKEKKNKKSPVVLRNIWKKYVAPQWKMLVSSIVLMILAGGMDAFAVKMLEPVFNEVFIDKNKEILDIVALQILSIFFVKGFAHYFQSVTMTKIGIKIARDMQIDLYRHLMYMDVKFFSKKNSSDLLNHFIGDIAILRDAILNGVTTLFKDSFTVAFLIILMFYKNFEMALVMSMLWPIAFWPIIRFGKLVKSKTKRQQENIGGLFSSLIQSIQGIRMIKAYSMEENEISNIENSTEVISKLAFKITKQRELLSPLMEFFGGIAVAGTLTYGGWKIMNGQLTTGEFMVFLMAIIAAYKPLKSLARINTVVQTGVMAAERIHVLMSEKAEIAFDGKKPELKIKTGKISVENVSFCYDEKEILKNISMLIEPNKTTAIVGASGSGKSTLINLLMRFYDVKSGAIKIDGQDIRDVNLHTLRDNIAFVSQDVVLFDTTIKNNILFGKPGATDAEVYQAAVNSAADSFIKNQSDGYETRLGERGTNLSGGQRQMISIARAMLKNAPILLLDEATSALDARSEKIVQTSLEKLMNGRTTVVIAHRLSTIINADKIVVFDNGKIIEEGTHDELLAKGGAYSKLYSIQYQTDD